MLQFQDLVDKVTAVSVSFFPFPKLKYLHCSYCYCSAVLFYIHGKIVHIISLDKSVPKRAIFVPDMGYYRPIIIYEETTERHSESWAPTLMTYWMRLFFCLTYDVSSVFSIEKEEWPSIW
jgi:hypothetical protein